MKWICLISDTGYTYENAISISIELNLETGGETGCFQLGYLVTKATPNLICSGNMVWAPISFPHVINVGGSEEKDSSDNEDIQGDGDDEQDDEEQGGKDWTQSITSLRSCSAKSGVWKRRWALARRRWPNSCTIGTCTSSACARSRSSSC